eukprot:m.48579 g.48579  ORF g.48579 m.48579 type:complete len:249 (+) comp6039_c0_seq1:47-793(+)
MLRLARIAVQHPTCPRMCYAAVRLNTAGPPTKKSHKLPLESPPADMEMVRYMLRHVWPRDNPAIKHRVVAAMGLLVGSKILSLQVPFLFKKSVDALNVPPELLDSSGALVLTSAGAILIGYGAARAGAALFNEMRNAVFSKAVQHSVKEIAKTTFSHLHSLDLQFHLSRQTGAMQRAIDRGTRSVAVAVCCAPTTSRSFHRPRLFALLIMSLCAPKSSRSLNRVPRLLFHSIASLCATRSLVLSFSSA